jgi:hypothetical protein
MIPIPTNSVRASSASGVLTADLTAAASSFAIEGGGSAFPSSNFEVEIDGEIILVGARASNTFSSLSRGYAGTSAVPHNRRDGVFHVVSGSTITGGLLPADVTTPVALPGDVVILQGAGAPVDGTTGDNVAGTGSLYTDTTNGVLYINTGAIDTPTWVKVGTQT